MQLKTLFQTFRPSFLLLTPICVFLGVSTALTMQSQISLFMVFLILTGAITAHISVNTLNEYFDFKSGLDLVTEKTPFSGGSGALPGNPEMAASVFIAGMVSLLITIMIGVYLIIEHGLQILPIGLAGVVLIFTYTQWLNRFPLLCLFAPGIGFGILMVVGTHVILTGQHSPLPWLVSLVPFFLVNNLLLLNQYPDKKADASVGRKTFPIAFGLGKSNAVYAFFVIASYALIPLFIVDGRLPQLSYIALIPALFSLFSLSGAFKYSATIGNHPPYLGANVASALLTPLLLGLSIIYG